MTLSWLVSVQERSSDWQLQQKLCLKCLRRWCRKFSCISGPWSWHFYGKARVCLKAAFMAKCFLKWVISASMTSSNVTPIKLNTHYETRRDIKHCCFEFYQSLTTLSLVLPTSIMCGVICRNQSQEVTNFQFKSLLISLYIGYYGSSTFF